MKARYYYPDLGIFTQPDQMSHLYPGLSPYAYVANNPINFNDPTGMIIEGVSEISAKRVENEIHNTFQGKKFNALRNLFQLDGNRMKQIDEGAFNNAIAGLSADERALANAYFLAINSDEIHYVDMTMSYEALNSKTITAFGLAANTKGSCIDKEWGGGANKSYGTGSISVVIMDSKANVPDFVYVPNGKNYSRYPTPAELLAHELLGHGYGKSHGRTEPWHQHEDAIQMTNLYWRVRGYNNFYRDGTWHGAGHNLGGTTSRKIPVHFKK